MGAIYILSPSGLDFSFNKGDTAHEGAFTIDRTGSESGPLRWELLLNTKNSSFLSKYSVILKRSDGVTKDIGSTIPNLLETQTSPNISDKWNLSLEIKLKPNQTNKSFLSRTEVCSFILNTKQGGIVTSTKRFIVSSIEFEKPAAPPIYYEIKPCNTGSSSGGNNPALIPCGEGNSNTDCLPLKYIAINEGCTVSGTSNLPIPKDNAYKINIRTTKAQGKEVSECYHLEQIDEKSITDEVKKACCTSNRGEGVLCTMNRSGFSFAGNCTDCTLKTGGPLLKLQEQAIAYLLAHGWAVDLDSKNTGFDVPMQFKQPNDPLGQLAPLDLYTVYRAEATFDQVRQIIPMGAQSSGKKYEINFPFKNLSKNEKNAHLKGKDKVGMDESYIEYSVNHSSEQSIMLLTRWRAKFLFDLMNQAGAVPNPNMPSQDIRKLTKIENLEADKDYLDYLYKNSVSRAINASFGDHFSMGINYFYENDGVLSSENQRRENHRSVGIRTYFEVRDLINLFKDRSLSDTDFRTKARSVLRVEVSARGNKGSLPRNEFKELLRNGIETFADQLHPIAGVLLSLQNVMKELKESDSILTNTKVTYERYFLNGSTLKIFHDSGKEIKRITQNRFKTYTDGQDEYSIQGIQFKLATVDNAVLSFIHSESGEMELGICYTKNSDELKTGHHLGQKIVNFLNSFGEGEQELTFFSGLSIRDTVNGGKKSKQYAFNTALSLHGKIQKRKNISEDDYLAQFLSGFSFSLNASLLDGLNKGLEWTREGNYTLIKKNNFAANFNYRLSANSEDAFTNPIFNVGVDAKYQTSLITFGNILGSIHLEIFANASAKLSNRNGSLSELLSFSAIAAAKLTWRNRILSFLGFPFDIHPNLDISFGFGFVAKSTVSIDDVTKSTSGTSFMTVPFGHFSFTFVLLDDFREALRKKHTSVFKILAQWIEKVPGAGVVLGAPFRVLSKVPILSVLGKGESVFEYLVKVSYIKSYLEFMKAVDDCENSLRGISVDDENRIRNELLERFRKFEFTTDISSEDGGKILRENEDFLNFLKEEDSAGIGAGYCGPICIIIDAIKEFLNKGSFTEDNLFEYITEKKNIDKNKYQELKKKFIDQEIKKKINVTNKNPRRCDCIRENYKESAETTKRIYAEMVANYPQMGGEFGIIKLFFEKMSNIYFSLLYEKMLRNELEKKVIDKISYIDGKYLDDEKLKEEFVRRLFKYTNEEEDLLFSRIDKDYREFRKKGNEVQGLKNSLSIESQEFNKVAPKGETETIKLGLKIKECLLSNGESNYCQSVLYEWIRFSRILGNISEIQDKTGGSMFINEKDESLGNRKNLGEFHNWVSYLKKNYFPSKDKAEKKDLATIKKCGCPDPYVSLYEDYSDVDYDKYIKKLLFFAGDNVPMLDIEEGILALSYVANHLTEVCSDPSNLNYIAVPDKESVEKLGYYHNSPVSLLKPSKNGSNPPETVYYELEDFNFSGIRKNANEFLDDLVLVKHSIGNFDSRTQISDWFAFYASLGEKRMGPFSTTNWSYYNPYTQSNLVITEETNACKNLVYLAQDVKELLKNVAFTKINYSNTSSFREEFFYPNIKKIQLILQKIDSFKKGVFAPEGEHSNEETLAINYTGSLRASVVSIIEKDLFIMVEIFKQVVEAELNAKRPESPKLLKDVIEKSSEDNDMKSISDEIKKRLLKDNEKGFDLEFLFNFASLRESLSLEGTVLARDASVHKQVNDNIGHYYYLWTQQKGELAPQKPRDISDASDVGNSCKKPDEKEPDKALYKQDGNINSPHRSQYDGNSQYNSSDVENSTKGSMALDAGYLPINSAFSPYVSYLNIDTNRAATFSSIIFPTPLTNGRVPVYGPCRIILLKGIHGIDNLRK